MSLFVIAYPFRSDLETFGFGRMMRWTCSAILLRRASDAGGFGDEGRDGGRGGVKSNPDVDVLRILDTPQKPQDWI